MYSVFISTYKTHRTSFNSFRAFCSITQYENWFTKGWCFLLNPTRISKNQIGFSHQVSKWFVIEWINQCNALYRTKLLLYNLTNLRILMYREYHLNIFKFINQIANSLVYMAHRFTQIFTTMCCNKNRTFFRI